jgi:exonuclease III
MIAGIETNPGPQKIIKVISHNVRGLTHNQRKIKDILSIYKSFIGKIDRQLNIICLQETHELNTKVISRIWEGNVEVNNGTRSSCGTAILLGKEWNVKEVIKDNVGRYIILNIENNSSGKHYIISNIYAPNNRNEAHAFYDRVFLQIEALNEKLREKEIEIEDQIMVGDFNTVLEPVDRNNEKLDSAENLLAKKLKDLLNANDYHDCVIHDKDSNKYTWQNKRNNRLAQSRIDRIYATVNMLNKCKSFYKKWGIGNSDHAAVFMEVIDAIHTKGKGITKLNVEILKDEQTSNNIRIELQEWLKNINENWDPHKKWEYCKMALRSITLPIMGISKKQAKMDKEKIIDEMSDIRNSKTDNNNTENNRYNQLNEKLQEILENEAKEQAVKSGVKWREEGERSTKYFFGLRNKRAMEAYIGALKDHNGVLRHSIQDLMAIASKFYKTLYADPMDKKVTRLSEDMFKLCPKINKSSQQSLDKEITMTDLKKTLSTTKDSAPGEDGISYQFYKRYLDLLGPYLIDSWNYSLKTGNLAPSQTRSCITLLPKKGKDGQEIKNWRPISLSNCDLKIITKTLALRVNKVLPEIIHQSQSGYVPGRNIASNIRLMRLVKANMNKIKDPALLISLDVKKAYDSLNHKSM